MTSFATYLAVFAVFAVSSISAGTVPERFDPLRDEWYKLPKGLLLNDKPRVFDLKDGCPAQSFYFDCNGCFCNDGKHAGCTLMGCPEVPQIVDWAPGKPCPAGRNFYHKCNDCYCSSDGKQAACTYKACPDFSKPESN